MRLNLFESAEWLLQNKISWKKLEKKDRLTGIHIKEEKFMYTSGRYLKVFG